VSVYDVLLDQLEKASAHVAGKTAVFYSGVDSNGEENFENATACVDKYQGAYYTLDDTQAGTVLRRAGIALGQDEITDDQFRALLTIASRKFSLEASGNVIAFVEGKVAQNSYFVQAEIDPLLANSRVASINGLPRAEVLSQQQGLKPLSLVALIGDEADCFPPSGPPPTATSPVTPPETGPAIQEPQPESSDSSTPWLAIGGTAALIVVGAVGAFVGVDEAIAVGVGIAELALQVHALLQLAAATNTSSSGGPLQQMATPTEKQSGQVATGITAADLEIGVANGDVDKSILSQFTSSQLQLADLTNVLGSAGASVSGTISDGAGKTIQISMRSGSNGEIDLQISGPSGAFTVNIVNAGTSSTAVAFKSKDGKEEGAFLVNTSSQENSAFIRKDQGAIIFGFLNGQQITLSKDGKYSYDSGGGNTITIGGRDTPPAQLSASDESAIAGFLTNFGAALTQDFATGIPTVISDLLQSSNGSYTLLGPDGNDVVFGASGTPNLVATAPTGNAELLFGGNGKSVTDATANTELLAVGDNNTLNSGGSGQKIISVGQGSILNSQQTGGSGTTVLGAIGTGGASTLNAGAGNNIMIGEGVNTTFNINASQDSNAIDVVWGTGGADTINANGPIGVLEVNAPDATLASVKNLDVQALYQQLLNYNIVEHWIWGDYTPNDAQKPVIIVINPTSSETLILNGQQTPLIDNNPSYPQVGGDLLSLSGFLGTPQLSLANYQMQASPNASGGSGGGTDPSVVDQSSIYGQYVSDTLVSITAATVFDYHNTLIAANGTDTLTDQGGGNTLIGNVAGSVLQGSQYGVTTAAYTADGVVVNLETTGTGTAYIQGGSASDTLYGIGAAAALGTNDTLVGSYYGTSTLTALAGGNTLVGGAGSGTTTLVGLANGSTLMAGEGAAAIASYAIQDVAVDLGAGTATINGSSISDKLIGIHVAVVSEAYDTLIGDSGNDTLTAEDHYYDLVEAGSGNQSLALVSTADSTLIGGAGNDVLNDSGTGFSNTLIAGSGSSTLTTSVHGDTLIGGSGTDLLSSGGSNSLVAGSGYTTLLSTGFGDVLFGNAGNSVLIGDLYTTAAYAVDNVVVDLSAGTAKVNGSSRSDTLQNITNAEVFGSHDTLLAGAGDTTLTSGGSDDTVIGGAGNTTLIASGSGDTLIAGSGTTDFQSNAAGNALIAGTGATSLDYLSDNTVVTLVTDTATVNGSETHDTFIGVTNVNVLGKSDTLLGSGSGEDLTAGGVGDTLIAGGGVETLASSGSNNTLIAGSGSDNLSSFGSNDLLLAGDAASETLSSSGTNNTLVAGGGADVLSSSGYGDTLIGGAGTGVLSSTGTGNSLIVGRGIDTLSTSGYGDTLFGNGNGSTLIASAGSGGVVAYTANDVMVNLATGEAGVNGSSVTDTLTGFSTAVVLGSSDTLIDGNGGSTLLSNAAGNTLIGGSGQTVAAYTLDNLAINLAAGTAGVSGSAISDSLVGIHAAYVSGSNDTLTGDSAGDLLSSSGSGDTLIAGTGADTLTSSGTGNTLTGGAGADTLSSSGQNDVLHAGNGASALLSSGFNNTLIAGSGIDTLSSTGTGDTLFGNGAGSTLNASAANGAVAAYSLNNVTVNVAAGTAKLSGSSASDTLVGFTTFAALGSNDTLIDGNQGSTFFSDAAGNTLKGGTGMTFAAYALDDVTVNLSAGTAKINGSTASDTLVGVHAVTVSGSNDTLIGDGGADVLASSGTGNTLIAGGGIDTLMSNGGQDTLFGNLLGSTLKADVSALTPEAHAIAAYAANNATINLVTSTAQLNGSSVYDNLSGFNTAEALGSNDTLVGASGSTLISDAAGNTLTASAGLGVIADYELDDVTVNLVTGTAGVNGSGVSDTLIGMQGADVFGSNDTIISNGTGNTLTVANSSDVIAYAVNNLSIAFSVDVATGANGYPEAGATAGVNGSNAEDLLVGVSNIVVSGSGDSVTGGMTSESFTATGSNDVLISGASSDMLIASGNNDTLSGNLAGSVLKATQSATGTVALYTYDDVTVDLEAGTASSPISSASDTLIGIAAAELTGAYGTLLAGTGIDTLSSSGLYNSLVGGSGTDTISSSGQYDTLIAGSGSQTLISQGSGNTLIAGTSADMLTSTGTGDTLQGNALGSTLNASGGTGAIAAYAIDYVTVDLASHAAGIDGSNISDALAGITNATVSGTSDTVIAGGGASVLTASGLDDTLIGGSGVDTLQASGSSDTLSAGTGTDLLSSSGSQNVLIASTGTDILSSSGFGDVLQGGSGIDTLLSSGNGNTLIGGGGADILSSTGIGDTLFGNGAGSTLIGTNGSGTVAAYAMNDVTINLATGTAKVSGAGASDTLLGISSVLLSGSNDTIIGGSGTTTIHSDGANNTITAGTGSTTVVYALDNVAVNLATFSATVNGASASDVLNGIRDVHVAGSGDTITGGSGVDILSSSGFFNTLIAGTGADTLSSSGEGDSLFGGSGADILTSSGESNVLIAGSAASTLSSTGFGDTLIGNGAGSTLDGAAGIGTIAAYTADRVAVNLGTGTATVTGSDISDTLLGITAVMASGTNDTLIGGAGATTLFSNAGGNTLEAGTGQTSAAYTQDDVTVNLATSSATVNGSGVHDVLVGITDALVSGSGDTLIGGSGNDILGSNGQGNTLVAGTAIDTLSSSGFGDTLIGNAAGSTLDGTNGVSTVAAYALNDVTVNLAASTATVNGSGVSDTLLGISVAAALGTNDTLIGGADATTLYSNAAGNTLIAGAGQTTVAYTQGDVTVNLASSTASVNGSSASDTLVGITAADVSGASATLIGSSNGNILEADGSGDALLGGAGAETLISTGSSNILTAGSGNDLLSSSGFGDTLIAGGGADILSSSGFGNSLVAGSGVDSLISTGESDTLFGNGAGSTLDASGGIGALADYTQNNVIIDLATGTASIAGSGSVDRLIGITIATASGSNDTLIGGGAGTTLIGNGAGDTLEVGTSQTVALYNADNAIVDLATGSAAIAGRSASDTLVGIGIATVSGTADTLIGGSGADILGATGSDDVVMGGAGANTLIMTSGINTFVAGSGNDTFVVLSASTDSSVNQPQNLISNFDSSKDTIDLSNIAGVNSFVDLSFSTVTYGSQSYLQVTLGNSGQSITLSGVSEGDLSASNFVFPPGSAYTVVDATSVSQGQSLTFVVSRSIASSSAETVSYAVNGGATQTLVFNPGEMSKDIVVSTSNNSGNTYGETGTTYSVTLLSATGGATVSSVAATGTATDPTAAPVYSIAGQATTTNGGGVVEFTISRSSYDATGPVTVDYTLGGTAVAGTDYTATSGSVTFAPGQLSQTITIQTTAEDEQVGKSITATLTSLSGAGSISSSAASATDQIEEIASPPVITSEVLAQDTGASSTDYVAQNGQVTLRGTAPLGSTVAIYDGNVDIGSATVSGSNWTFSTDLGQGTHDLQAVASLSNGATLTSAPAHTIVVDDTLPQPVITAVDTVGVGVADIVVINGTAPADSSVQVFSGSTLLGTTTTNAAGAWSFDAGTMTGVFGFSARVTDLAGNVGVSPTWLYSTTPTSIYAPDPAAPGGIVGVSGGVFDPPPTAAVLYFGSGYSSAEVYMEADGYGNLTVGFFGDSTDSVFAADDLTDVSGVVQSKAYQLDFADGLINLGGSMTFTWFGNHSNYNLTGSDFGSNVFDITIGNGNITFGNTSQGGDGTNTINFDRGDGVADVTPNHGTGIVAFASDISAQDVYWQADGYGNLYLKILGDTTDSILVQDDLTNQSGQVVSDVNELQFSDGTTIYLGQGTSLGGPLTFTWLGNSSNYNLTGSNFGSNVFEITTGNGSLTFGNSNQGGSGENTIDYDEGDGQLSVTPNGGTGIVDFGSDISAQNVYWQADGYGNLYLKIRGDTVDSIIVDNDLKDQSGSVTSSVSELEFGDGTTISLAAPLTFTWLGSTNNFNLTGSNFGANIFDVTAQNGSVTFGTSSQGGNGQNTIEYDKGDGQLGVTPNNSTGVVEFGSDISAQDVYWQADGYGNLYLRIFGDTADDILVYDGLKDQSGSVTSSISALEFGDGTTVSLTAPLTFTWFGNTNNFNLSSSNYGANLFVVTAQNGSLTFGNSSQGGSGQNTIEYDKGDGQLGVTPNNGTGVVEFGSDISAQDVYWQADGYGNLYLRIFGDTTDDILVYNGLKDQSGSVTSSISELEFADGTTVSLAAPLTFTWLGNTNNFSLTGSNYGANLFDVTAHNGSITFGNTNSGGNGENTIEYAEGDGSLTVSLNGGTGTLAMGAGISASDVYLQSDSSGDLYVKIAGDASDSILLYRDLTDSGGTVTSALGQIQFSDGSTINLGQGTPPAFSWYGTANSSMQGSNYGANTFIFGQGTESATGGTTSSGGNGNNTYLVSSNTGRASISANASAGSTNELDFTGGITDENLWFLQSGNDLKIDLIGTSTQVDVAGWFSSSSNQLQEITAGGLKIDSQISQLVQAMATYSSNNPGFDPTSSSISAVPNDTNLQSALSAAWHS
jgi:Ca2+-binding RTX toxin-like protein